jgi:hypothetical protein
MRKTPYILAISALGLALVAPAARRKVSVKCA